MEILLIIRTNFGEPNNNNNSNNNNNNNNNKTLVGGKIYFGKRFFDVRSVLITHFKLTYLKIERNGYVDCNNQTKFFRDELAGIVSFRALLKLKQLES